jgi:hypothetical protein
MDSEQRAALVIGRALAVVVNGRERRLRVATGPLP